MKAIRTHNLTDRASGVSITWSSSFSSSSSSLNLFSTKSKITTSWTQIYIILLKVTTSYASWSGPSFSSGPLILSYWRNSFSKDSQRGWLFSTNTPLKPVSSFSHPTSFLHMTGVQLMPPSLSSKLAFTSWKCIHTLQ